MKKVSVIILLLFLTLLSASAQTSKALIIGIDNYAPPAGQVVKTVSGRTEFKNLEGSINDVASIRSLIQVKFNFSNDHITELTDQNATRANILTEMQRLLHESQAGDIAFIYYAGHGSLQKNSKSREAGKKDQTIVPSDTWQKGIGDIRDKELAKIFNGFVDKKIKLTVILDCCHSGSMSRGMVFQKPGTRYLVENELDANDDSNPTPPEERPSSDFLIISASQDNESADEDRDDNGVPHGAFTIALLQALNQQSVDASAMNLFKSIRSVLKYNGKKQEPVMGGSTERQQQTLFGISRGKLSDKLLLPVLDVTGNTIYIQAGFAEQINKDMELRMVNDTSILIRVDAVLGINKSRCIKVKGDVSNIKPGLLFQVTNWVSSAAPLLKLYMPASDFSYDRVLALAALNKELKDSKKMDWVNDLSKTEPHVTAYFNKNILTINTNGSNIKEEAVYTVASITQSSVGKSFFFNLPLVNDLSKSLKQVFASNHSMVFVSNPNEAAYLVYGTINKDGKPSYGLLRSQLAERDSLEAMPLQTKSFDLISNTKEAYDDVARNIYEYAMRLSKVRGWMNLTAPKGGSAFPFHLQLINETANKVDALTYKIGDRISIHLVADTDYNNYTLTQKYVYCFGIDVNGSMVLLYPEERSGNVENRFPKYDRLKMREDSYLFKYDVAEPVGTDNLYLIATDEPIEGYAELFTQEGVKALKINPSGNPIIDVLNMGNENAKEYSKTPSNWTLLRMSAKSTH